MYKQRSFRITFMGFDWCSGSISLEILYQWLSLDYLNRVQPLMQFANLDPYNHYAACCVPLLFIRKFLSVIRADSLRCFCQMLMIKSIGRMLTMKVVKSARKGPSIKSVRYLDPFPPLFACNTQWKCIGDFTPPPSP